MAHYTVFLDTFAPAIVSVQTWNNSNLVSDACSGDAGAFEKLLSVSDEAFMLVTMVSYRKASAYFARKVSAYEGKPKNGTL